MVSVNQKTSVCSAFSFLFGILCLKQCESIFFFFFFHSKLSQFCAQELVFFCDFNQFTHWENEMLQCVHREVVDENGFPWRFPSKKFTFILCKLGGQFLILAVFSLQPYLFSACFLETDSSDNLMFRKWLSRLLESVVSPSFCAFVYNVS